MNDTEVWYKFGIWFKQNIKYFVDMNIIIETQKRDYNSRFHTFNERPDYEI